jgi:hypothetical protein
MGFSLQRSGSAPLRSDSLFMNVYQGYSLFINRFRRTVTMCPQDELLQNVSVYFIKHPSMEIAIIIIMALQPFVVPWQFLQFLDQ